MADESSSIAGATPISSVVPAFGSGQAPGLGPGVAVEVGVRQGTLRLIEESRLQSQVQPLPGRRSLESAAELWPGTPYALFTLIPILSVAAAVAVQRHRIRRAESLCGPQQLFVELCRQHSIDAAGQRLLKRIAAGAKLSQPAEMFVLPSRFDAATAAAARLRAREGEKLWQIRQQLFGGEAETLANPTTSSSSCPFPRSLPSSLSSSS